MTESQVDGALAIWALPGIPEIRPGADLADVVWAASVHTPLADGDIVVITSKILSKAEGRFVDESHAAAAIEAETVRVVATRGRTRIVQNRLGVVGAAAGVDASNTPQGTVLLLPEDPDRSARELVRAFADRGARVGVIISDTLGRPWREGQTDIAIGAAGVTVFSELAGHLDSAGRPLVVTRPCLADELAAAADLVKKKTSGTPVAVVRGMASAVGSVDLPGARSIQRAIDDDLFTMGTRDAFEAGFAAGKKEHS